MAKKPKKTTATTPKPAATDVTRPKRTARRRRNGAKTPASEARFLDALRKAKSIGAAAKAAQVDRRTVYRWREADPAFAESWDEAWDVGTDHLEDIALRAAQRGSERVLIALLRSRRPERFARTDVHHAGSLELTLTNAAAALDVKLARLPKR
jgi:hypothetical protein